MRKLLPWMLIWLATAGCASGAAKQTGEVRSGAEVRMVRFEGGRFRPAGKEDEVEVAAFLIDATEVTAGAYAACVNARACGQPNTGQECTFGSRGKERHPINCVSWDVASAYCGWAGKRLPTEAEWEWAARGGAAARRFPWGEEPPADQVCWNGRGSPLGKGKRRGPCPVGSFPHGDSPEGLRDMAGNVQEWTSTVWKGAARVCRGGSWFHEDDVDLLTSKRAFYSATTRDDAIGFRCVATP